MKDTSTASEKLANYLAATIESKVRERDELNGEISALRSTLSALRQFERGTLEQAKAS